MTTSRTIQVKSEIEHNEPLSDYTRAYLNERVRNGFYDYVLRRFHEAAKKENLTKTQLARRLGLGTDRISKILGAPGNWTLDTISELLVGICREELIPYSEPYLNRASRNFRGTDLLDNLLATPSGVDEIGQGQSGNNLLKSRSIGAALDVARRSGQTSQFSDALPMQKDRQREYRR